ncbi:MAG: hypothetical protein Tsb0021_14850 [Chlamydiales bacterium]
MLKKNMIYISPQTLSANLVQLSSSEVVVPGFFGHRLYTRGVTASLLIIIWKIYERITKKNGECQKKLREDIKITLESLHYHINQMQNTLQKVDQYVKNAKMRPLFRNEAVEFKDCRRQINAWHTWINPSLKRAVFPQATQWQRKLETHENSHRINELFRLNKQISIWQKLNKIETVTHSRFPLTELQMILEKEEKEFPQSFSNWFESHHRRRDFTDRFHQALLSCFNPLDAALIEHKISKHCKTEQFTDSSDKVRQKYKKIDATEQYSFWNGNRVQHLNIGEEITGHGNSARYFLLQNDPSTVAVFPFSRSAWLVQECFFREIGCDQPERINVKQVHSEGKFILLEKYGSSLNHYQWTSHSQALNSNDKRLADSLIQLIKHYHQKNIMPKGLQPKHLLYDSAKTGFRTYKIFLQEHFDFRKMETFVYQLTKNCPVAYRYIVSSTPLKTHGAGHFLKESLKEYLCKYVSPQDIIEDYDIPEEYLDIAEELCRQATLLFRECCEDIVAQGLTRLHLDEQKRLKKILSDKITESGYIGRIPEGIKESVILAWKDQIKT